MHAGVRPGEGEMTNWTLTYDPKAKAVYIQLRDDLVAMTREINDSVMIDLDADGNLVGVEVLNVETEPR